MLPGLLRAMPREAVAARVAAAAVGGFDGRRNRMGLDPLFGELPVDDVMIGLAGRERPDVHQQEISYALGDALGLLDAVHAAQVDHLAAPGSPPRCSAKLREFHRPTFWAGTRAGGCGVPAEMV